MVQQAKTAVSDMVFIGVNKRVAALRRDNGELLWQWKSPKGSGYVALLLDGEQLLVSVEGYTYSLDARTGHELWANPLTGFGVGIACIATTVGSSGGGGAAAVEAMRRRQTSAGAGGAGANR